MIQKNFLVIKNLGLGPDLDLNPDSIRTVLGNSPDPCLDPDPDMDPDSMNPDLKLPSLDHYFKWTVIFKKKLFVQ